MGLLSVVLVLEGPAPDDEVAATTSGNCCLKLASSSSPGFCELVLETPSVSNRACEGGEAAVGEARAPESARAPFAGSKTLTRRGAEPGTGAG